MLVSGVGRVTHYGLQDTDCQAPTGGHIFGVDNRSDLANTDPGADPLIGTICDGTYEILSRVGKGGMGSVYRAYHRHLDRQVAIKILRGQLARNPSAVQRFRQEARSLSLLSHPNIVHCYAFGIHAEHCFLAMDFVDGTTLKDEVAERGPLSEERFFKIFHQALSALAHAHANGIIHRDLKPDNIMLVKENNDRDIVKLVDFGIAKVSTDVGTMSQELTQSGGIVGSPQYMSAEQCSGKPLDARSDLYSLGCVMYFALTGSPPFVSESLVDIVRQHVEADSEPLPEHVSGAVSNLIETAMSKHPSDRFASAAEMDAALAAAAATNREPRRPRRKARRPLIATLIDHPRVVFAGLVAVSLAALAAYKMLNDPATELNTQLKTQKMRYLYEVATTSAAAPHNPDHNPTVPQYLALSQSFDQLMQTRLKLASYELDRGENSHAAAVMDEFVQDIRAFEDTCHVLPRVNAATIGSITATGRRLIAADERISGGPCIVLAIHLCRTRLDKPETLRDETIASLTNMEDAVDALGIVDRGARHFELPGNRHIQLPTQMDGYMYLVRAAFVAEEPQRVQKLASKLVESARAEKPLQNSKLRPEQSTRLIRAAQALEASFRRQQAIEVISVVNRICRLDEPDPDGAAPAAGFYSAFYRFEINPHDPEVATFLNKSLKAAAALGVNTSQIHLLYADYCEKNHDRKAVYAHLRQALVDNGFPGHMLSENPPYKDAHFRLGEMLARDGKKVEALAEFAAFNKAIESEQGKQDGTSSYFADYSRLVNMCVALGLSDAAQSYAIKSYQRGCALKSFEQQAHQAHALSIIASSRRDFPAALTWANTAIAAGENGHVVPWAIGAYYSNRAGVELALKQPQKAYSDACYAEELTAKPLQQFPKGELRAFEILYSFNKATASARLNKLDEAESSLRQCIRACGRLPEWNNRRIVAARELCAVLRKMGKVEQARNIAKRHGI